MKLLISIQALIKNDGTLAQDYLVQECILVFKHSNTEIVEKISYVNYIKNS